MKTLTYSLIAIIILSIILPDIVCKAKSPEYIVIQATERTVSAAVLKQSAYIISDRLKSFSAEKFEVSLIPEKDQILVSLHGSWDVKTVKRLLVQKGELSFYETYTRDELSGFMKGDDHLFSLVDPGMVNQGAMVGCTSPDKMERVNEYINSLVSKQECIFMWSLHPKNSETCLYALKHDKEKRALPVNTDIENLMYKQDTASKQYEIEIRFKDSAIHSWSDATKRNIDREIAVILDNEVIFAPVVKSEINDGRCSITGKFSETETKFIVAIGSKGVLPTDFTIVE